MKNNLTLPTVSICCIAYNQKDYIRQTLDSFLMQRTNFNFEIIIHDDASTDGTDLIVKEYALNFPTKIKPIFQTKNKYVDEGLSFQYNYVFPHVKGEYIAFCEGDDYWTDPFKLQKQVDFLEKNKDYGLVHTRAIHYFEKTKEFKKLIGFEVNDIENLLIENTISNLTVCLRSSLFREYIKDVRPVKHKKWSTCDYPIWLWFIQHSKFHFINEVTGVYRIIDTSICHHKDDELRLKFHEGIIDIIDYYLPVLNSHKKSLSIKSRYLSAIISMYLHKKSKGEILKSIKIFYEVGDVFNLLWIFMTLPFINFNFLVKASYKLRNVLFHIFKIYPNKE